MTVTTARYQDLGRASLMGLLRAYRLAISPAIGNVCRFEPSCSVYAEQAVGRFGVCKGSYLAARRLLRCHPFAKGGLDPVPPAAATPSRDRFTEDK